MCRDDRGPAPHRWRVAIMGTVLEVCLGTVYAWSYFQQPIVRAFQCSQSQAAWAFSLAIGFLGLAAAWAGLNLSKFPPARLAMTGGALYATGYLLAAWALSIKSLLLFYLGFGLVGGIGLGLGYVTPVAIAAKWFPDKKGLVTGMVVMGFGLGALVMSKAIAPILMTQFNGHLTPVFGWIGLILFPATLLAGGFLKNPPPGFIPEGWSSPASMTIGPNPVQSPPASPDLSPPTRVLPPITNNRPSATKNPRPAASGPLPASLACLRSSKFLLMWLVFFCNISAGIMFIGFQAPMIQDLLKRQQPEQSMEQLAATGATLIAISSIFNGLGRFFWGGLSDRLGRVQTFRLILGTQIVVLISLLLVVNPLVFAGLVCYVLLCYGGGFGTMPSFVLDVFGPARMPMVYGALLTAWSTAGIAGPQLAALIKDHFPTHASGYAFSAAAALLCAGLLAAAGLTNDPEPDRIAPRAG